VNLVNYALFIFATYCFHPFYAVSYVLTISRKEKFPFKNWFLPIGKRCFVRVEITNTLIIDSACVSEILKGARFDKFNTSQIHGVIHLPRKFKGFLPSALLEFRKFHISLLPHFGFRPLVLCAYPMEAV